MYVPSNVNVTVNVSSDFVMFDVLTTVTLVAGVAVIAGVVLGSAVIAGVVVGSTVGSTVTSGVAVGTSVGFCVGFFVAEAFFFTVTLHLYVPLYVLFVTLTVIVAVHALLVVTLIPVTLDFLDTFLTVATDFLLVLTFTYLALIVLIVFAFFLFVLRVKVVDFPAVSVFLVALSLAFFAAADAELTGMFTLVTARATDKPTATDFFAFLIIVMPPYILLAIHYHYTKKILFVKKLFQFLTNISLFYNVCIM